MNLEDIDIIKSTGEKVKFSLNKLYASLLRTGANENTIKQIINTVRDELYSGISTKEIYNRAFILLKKKNRTYASKYKLKKAIYELGPTGFPFEKFISTLLQYSGYETQTNQILSGKCVNHEIDILALKENNYLLIECKFHGDKGQNCNVKIPLYIHARFQDVKQNWKNLNAFDNPLKEGWVVTNTRFTKDAIEYGSCIGLNLLSWDYPKENGLKDRIDRLGLYPITVSTLLSNREKHFLLSRDVVLCRQLLKDRFFLDHLGISDNRKEKIVNELEYLCNS